MKWVNLYYKEKNVITHIFIINVYRIVREEGKLNFFHKEVAK